MNIEQLNAWSKNENLVKKKRKRHRKKKIVGTTVCKTHRKKRRQADWRRLQVNLENIRMKFVIIFL